MSPRQVIPHVAAFFASAGFVTAVPVIGYGLVVVWGIATAGDMGGPLNFVIIPVAAATIGFIAAAAYLPLGVLALRYPAVGWLLPMVVATLLFAGTFLFLSLRPGGPISIYAASAFVAAWFGFGLAVHLVILHSARRIAKWLSSHGAAA